jgi:hypothetical protein
MIGVYEMSQAVTVNVHHPVVDRVYRMESGTIALSLGSYPSAATLYLTDEELVALRNAIVDFRISERCASNNNNMIGPT